MSADATTVFRVPLKVSIEVPADTPDLPALLEEIDHKYGTIEVAGHRFDAKVWVER